MILCKECYLKKLKKQKIELDEGIIKLEDETS